MHYFETNHGQWEGDPIHSTVERAIRKAGELFTPSQLAIVIKLARRNKSYHVHEILPSDIIDCYNSLLADAEDSARKGLRRA